jgi:UDP-N-acetylglucosamine--N-acetylmuramyl-(pentapeptide) pyrophosphoryl-undecaprenol N-acetylglucosamine transferase
MISGGGTGGHVYPALVVARALVADEKAAKVTGSDACLQILYVGSQGGMEESLVAREGLSQEVIPAGGVRGLAPWAVAANLGRLALGFLRARRIVREFDPDAVLVTGGYVCTPVALAAWLHKVPVMIFLPDLEPGLAIRALSRLASRVAVSFPEATKFFTKEKAFVSGYPVREAFLTADKATARQTFQLDSHTPTLTVMGGSRGAQSINRAVSAVLEPLLDTCQVIHVSGRLDAAEMGARQEGLSPALKKRYRLYDYLHEEMPMAMAAADLVVARAGAATLGEFPALGLPSILVPYPYAGAHQETNASFLVRHGAAVRVADAELRNQLLPTVQALLRDRERLAQMSQRARGLARPDAAARIGHEMRKLAHVRRGGG